MEIDMTYYLNVNGKLASLAVVWSVLNHLTIVTHTELTRDNILVIDTLFPIDSVIESLAHQNHIKILTCDSVTSCTIY